MSQLTTSDNEFEDRIGVTKFVSLNGVPTKILIFDSGNVNRATGIEMDSEVLFDYDQLILMISGNPGEIEYYRNYLSRVHQQTKLAVIGVSNSGHNRVPSHLKMPNIHGNPHLYSLDGQILNKVAFIEKYVSPRTRLILLGHSIGTYMIIELLDQHGHIERMVDHCVLIMPSIDRMAETDMGKKVSRMLTPLYYYPLLTLSYALEYLLPAALQQRLAGWVLRNDRKTFHPPEVSQATIPECVLQSATALFNPNCLRALLHMTRCEFEQVLDPNLAAIERRRHKLTILYGERDHWCPLPNYERQRRQASDEVDMRLCLGPVDHAFVVDRTGTDHFANITTDILRNKLTHLFADDKLDFELNHDY